MVYRACFYGFNALQHASCFDFVTAAGYIAVATDVAENAVRNLLWGKLGFLVCWLKIFNPVDGGSKNRLRIITYYTLKLDGRNGYEAVFAVLLRYLSGSLAAVNIQNFYPCICP
jgi:hypothetical protein